MGSTSTVVPTVAVDLESAIESTSILEILQRVLLEYDANRRNRLRGLLFQWLKRQTAQQLADHLQLILDSGQHSYRILLNCVIGDGNKGTLSLLPQSPRPSRRRPRLRKRLIL
ncbi:hypothetical protein GYMLUDRAFT_46469, partial [Collybiopsis luxurians FD-317 M1]